MKECPSCGSSIDDTMAFCPVCGSKVYNEKKETKNTNSSLETDLAKAELYASDLFSRSQVFVRDTNAGETLFLNIINAYPTEPKAYIGYVNYIVRYIDRAINPKKSDEIISFCDLNGLIGRSEAFLNNATKYNVNNDYEIVQEITRLKGCLESFKMNQAELNSINAENTKKKDRRGTVFGLIAFGVGIIIIIAILLDIT